MSVATEVSIQIVDCYEKDVGPADSCSLRVGIPGKGAREQEWQPQPDARVDWVAERWVYGAQDVLLVPQDGWSISEAGQLIARSFRG